MIEPATGLAAISDIDTDVIATLTALGYSIVEAQAALQAIPNDAPQDVEERQSPQNRPRHDRIHPRPESSHSPPETGTIHVWP